MEGWGVGKGEYFSMLEGKEREGLECPKKRTPGGKIMVRG